jgi:hypothetical protein
MEGALEAALCNPIVRWTLLGQHAGLAVCRGWREHALAVAPEPALGAALCRQLCTRHTRGPPLPPLRRLPPLWRAQQRLLQLEALPLRAEGLLTVEVATGTDNLWSKRRMFQLKGATCLKAVAVQEPGSPHTFTTQTRVDQPLFPGESCSAQRCTNLLCLHTLWISWLHQFCQHLVLPLEEQAPFMYPGGMLWTGRVLCDLRMRYGDGWAYLRVSTQEALVESA